MTELALMMLAALSALIALISLRPDKFRIARSAIIDVPADVIYREVNDFHNWRRWSPWDALDANMTHAYEGTPLGVGSIYAWASEKQAGVGKMKIIESRQNERIRIKIEFQKPLKALHDIEFNFVPVNDTRTEVTWEMSGRHDFMGKAMNVFMSVDKKVGDQFEKGLANLKADIEAQR